jgi:hypothetical protein
LSRYRRMSESVQHAGSARHSTTGDVYAMTSSARHSTLKGEPTYTKYLIVNTFLIIKANNLHYFSNVF